MELVDGSLRTVTSRNYLTWFERKGRGGRQGETDTDTLVRSREREDRLSTLYVVCKY